MYDFLRLTHSILRYIVLLGGLGVIIAITNSARARVKGWSMLFTISLQIQFAIGIVLYFFYSPWLEIYRKTGGDGPLGKIARFFAMEHIAMMIIAIAIASIGHGRVKKALKNNGSLRPALILFIIALLVIFAAIPWPFRNLGQGWI